jgi:hypothetical protein
VRDRVRDGERDRGEEMKKGILRWMEKGMGGRKEG